MLCISDSLNKWSISNFAGKIEPAQIDFKMKTKMKIKKMSLANIKGK
jgi:hypothetical protein